MSNFILTMEVQEKSMEVEEKFVKFRFIGFDPKERVS